MSRKIGFGLLWLGFVTYAFLLAPPNDPQTLPLLQKLVTGQWQGINPLVVSLFNLLGIWPLIYACLMLVDGRGQKVKAFPFVLASFGVGAFAILPYLALRSPNPKSSGEQSGLLRLLESRWLAGAIALGALSFLGFGLTQGNWADFIQQLQTSRFVNVMSLDFCLVCGLVPALLGDDMARRGLQNGRLFWAIALIPLLGILAYLILRPPLQPQTSGEVAQVRELQGNNVS